MDHTNKEKTEAEVFQARDCSGAVDSIWTAVFHLAHKYFNTGYQGVYDRASDVARYLA